MSTQPGATRKRTRTPRGGQAAPKPGRPTVEAEVVAEHPEWKNITHAPPPVSPPVPDGAIAGHLREAHASVRAGAAQDQRDLEEWLREGHQRTYAPLRKWLAATPEPAPWAPGSPAQATAAAGTDTPGAVTEGDAAAAPGAPSESTEGDRDE